MGSLESWYRLFPTFFVTLYHSIFYTVLDTETIRADFDGQAVPDFIEIVNVGDQAIRELNALQDWAEVVTK
jgi:hypothetical protein